jgi:hypothetical protein
VHNQSVFKEMLVATLQLTVSMQGKKFSTVTVGAEEEE